MFGVGTSSSRNSENRESNFLILVKGPADNINDSFFEPEKRFGIILPSEIQNVVQVCIISVIIVIFMSKDFFIYVEFKGLDNMLFFSEELHLRIFQS